MAGLRQPTKAHLILGLIAIIAPLLFGTAAFGRLGETEPELIARYAKPVMRSREKVIEQQKIIDLADNLHFKIDDWQIIARLVGGRCESITYLKPGDWTDGQFRHVLESNGRRSQWEERKTASKKLHREWQRRDQATAVWRMLEGITLTTPAYERAKDALKKKAKEDASKLPKI